MPPLSGLLQPHRGAVVDSGSFPAHHRFMYDFDSRKLAVSARLAASADAVRLAKRTSSNLFRYKPRSESGRRIDLSGFNHILGVDPVTRILNVEGLATFESVIEQTLPHGLVTLITPELKHITVGGAIVGIGIESSGFRHGFFHDGLLEAEVLLPDGRVVLCTPGNEYADLFRALPNSYGTLGYVLRAKMQLMPAKPYVHLQTVRFGRLEPFLAAMHSATSEAGVDFVEGLLYSAGRFLLTRSRFTDQAPRVEDIYRRHVFYKLLDERAEFYLTAADYLFRYDPDWFWNIPDTMFYSAFRRFAPLSMRNSGFYKRFVNWRRRARQMALPGKEEAEEPLIQDWQVPWDSAQQLSSFALREADLEDRPWIATPIRTLASPTLYPVASNSLYFNLGCYCQVRKPTDKGAYYFTRIIDEKCFGLGGVKMLYSSTFLSKPKFDRIYNGEIYSRLKAKYDPQGRLPTLFEKCALPSPA